MFIPELQIIIAQDPVVLFSRYKRNITLKYISIKPGNFFLFKPAVIYFKYPFFKCTEIAGTGINIPYGLLQPKSQHRQQSNINIPFFFNFVHAVAARFFYHCFVPIPFQVHYTQAAGCGGI